MSETKNKVAPDAVSPETAQTDTGLRKFRKEQVEVINDAVMMAEELVSNYYKMSATQWLRSRYDVKTLAGLHPSEIVSGPFAHVIRYEATRGDTPLKSEICDFYKICLQDHAILDALVEIPRLKLFPFSLYLVTHELIHIVRFSRFLQSYHVSSAERFAEEKRVHQRTSDILKHVGLEGLDICFSFYKKLLKDRDLSRLQ